MSAFSRGSSGLVMPLRLATFSAKQTCGAKAPSYSPFQSISKNSRFFHNSSRLSAAKKSKPSKTPSFKPVTLKPLKPPTTQTKPSVASKYKTFDETLLSKSQETLLYLAPSFNGFILTCYTSGAFCLAWAAINFNATYLNPPDGVAWWTPALYGVVSFGMAVCGGYLLLSPARLGHWLLLASSPVANA